MKTIYILLISVIFFGCSTPKNKERSQTDRISQSTFPIHITKECGLRKEKIGDYNFTIDDYVKDSVQVSIYSDGNKIDEYNLSLIKDSSLKDKMVYMHGNTALLPIFTTIPAYEGNDTLNLTIDLKRTNCKVVTNSAQIIYHEKSDTIRFIAYNFPNKLVKFASRKKFRKSKNALKKKYAYNIDYETIKIIKRNEDSLNYSVELFNTVISDSKTGTKMKFNENPTFSYNYPLHYDLPESVVSYENNRGPFTVTNVTSDSIDSYPGYILYLERYGQNITAVLNDCYQMDTLTTEDIFVPGFLKPTFAGNND